MIIDIPVVSDYDDYYLNCIQEGMVGDFCDDDLYEVDFQESTKDNCIIHANELLEMAKEIGLIKSFKVYKDRVTTSGCGWVIWTHYIEVDVEFTDKIIFDNDDEVDMRYQFLEKFANELGFDEYDQYLIDNFQSPYPSDEFIDKYKDAK